MPYPTDYRSKLRRPYNEPTVCVAQVSIAEKQATSKNTLAILLITALLFISLAVR